jgi:prolyl-tRNA synthetase
MIDDYDVPGLYTIRPWAFSIWELVQDYVGQRFHDMGVKNVSLPLFVPFMNRLEERYDNIAPNVCLFFKISLK